LIIKKGGMESGLKKAETNVHEPKLFKVAGGSRPVMTEVPMAWSSMNHGDVFVLDSGKKIFVWRGSEASGMEKMTAGLIAAKLRDHVGEDITHLEDGEEEAECDEEWTEEKRGLWRVQNLELVPVPEGHWGQFYDGDCYLLLDKNQEEEHVYFWIGDECSVDEQAVAAIKAVELDNLFGGLPVQHREAQGFESVSFFFRVDIYQCCSCYLFFRTGSRPFSQMA